MLISAERLQRRPRRPPGGLPQGPRRGTRGGIGALAVPTDVTDPTACGALVSRAVERFYSVDVLVANARLGLYSSIPDGDPDDWRRMFEVNVSCIEA